MARPLRIEYPGAFYHVTSRGNEQKDVFKSRRDREQFLFYLESSVIRYDAVMHTYCLMVNSITMNNLSEIPKEKQLIALAEGLQSVYKLIEHHTGNQISTDFRTFITVPKKDLFDFLFEHPDLITKHVLTSDMISTIHDQPVLLSENENWVVCWMDHGKRTNETTYESLVEAAVDYLMAYFD